MPSNRFYNSAMLHLLAQQQSTGDPDYTGLFIGLCITLFVATAAVLLLASFRKRMNARDSFGGAGGTDFSLSDLRRMHANGQLTDEEFDRAKGRLVALTHASIAREKGKTADKIADEPRPELKKL